MKKKNKRLAPLSLAWHGIRIRRFSGRMDWTFLTGLKRMERGNGLFFSLFFPSFFPCKWTWTADLVVFLVLFLIFLIPFSTHMRLYTTNNHVPSSLPTSSSVSRYTTTNEKSFLLFYVAPVFHVIFFPPPIERT